MHHNMHLWSRGFKTKESVIEKIILKQIKYKGTTEVVLLLKTVHLFLSLTVISVY